MFNKIYIVVEGGVVQGVFGDRHLDAVIIDRDNGEVDREASKRNKELERELEDLKSNGEIVAID